MKIGIGAVIIGLVFLTAAAHAVTPQSDLSDDMFSDVKTGMRDARLPSAGNAEGGDAPMGEPSQPVEFVVIHGGKFLMGGDDSYTLPSGTRISGNGPIHEVAIKTFEISRTLVTVEQYAECVIAGGCTAPAKGTDCNWGRPHRQSYPINCVEWEQANQFAAFEGARLPTEAEYEYVAKHGGKNQKYPWGDANPTCDLAVMEEAGKYNGGCGGWGTMPVCSKPAGNTAQGICDMAGNVREWMQDTDCSDYCDAPYDGAPNDGSALEARRGSPGSQYRVVRGGGWNGLDYEMRSDSRDVRAIGPRSNFSPDEPRSFFRRDDVGIRLARDNQN